MHDPNGRACGRPQEGTMLFAMILTIAMTAAGQAPAPSPQKLFESGKYQQAIDSIQAHSDAPPDQVYLRALAHRKLNQNDEAKQAFASLAGAAEGSAWREIGNSGSALVDGNMEPALEAANKAVAADAGSAQAQYQLGLVESARNNQPQAAAAFAKAAELDPQMAYAHYEAGMAYYKSKRVDRMAVYFENFLKLAPAAPERPAVLSIMKTVRGK
jgi:tetratricopeptide (TPR) repeat protein